MMDKTTRLALVCEYIENSILPVYESEMFDTRHGVKHIRQVMRNTDRIIIGNMLTDVDHAMALIVAAFHDIRKYYKKHRKEGADVLRNDEVLREWFTKKEIETMAIAIEDHGRSHDFPFRNIYGKIVSDADRRIKIRRWSYL